DQLVDVVPGELAVCGARGREGLPDAPLVGDLVGEAQQGAPRSVLLDAAALTAAARQAARHDAHVADLGARAEAAAEQAATRDDRAAHARADREQRHVAAPAAGPEAVLGPAGGVGVVVDRDVEPGQQLGQIRPERFAAPRDVRRVVDGRLCGVDETGGGDTETGDLTARTQVLDDLDDGADDLGTVTRGGGAAL